MAKTPATHRIGRDSIHTCWSNALAPRLTVRPGDTVDFETVDCDYGSIARDIERIAGPEIAPDLKALIAAEAYPGSTCSKAGSSASPRCAPAESRSRSQAHASRRRGTTPTSERRPEAIKGILDYLAAHHGLTRAEAYILSSAVVDRKISQIVDRPNWTVTAYLPLAIFES